MQFEPVILSNMKTFCSFLMFLYVVAIAKNGIDAKPTNDAATAKIALETAKKAIDVSNEAMDLFNKVLDQGVPWGTFEATLNELNRFQGDYSKKAAALVTNIKSKLTQGINAYNQASKHVYEWCLVVEPLLKKYIALFDHVNKQKSIEQKQVLVKILDDGIKEMEKAQKTLGISSSSFNGVAGELTTLRHQLNTDFNENSDYFAGKISQVRKEGYGISSIFGPIGLAIAAGVVEGKMVPDLKARLRGVENFYNNLNKVVNKSFGDIDETKTKLNKEIRAIGDLKVQTETMSTYASIDGVTELRDIVIDSAKHLIDKCTAYRNRHKKFAA